MEEVLCIAPIEHDSIRDYVQNKSNKVNDLTTGQLNANVYVAVVKGENGIELVTYEPDEKYIKEVCIKYGHKVKK